LRILSQHQLSLISWPLHPRPQALQGLLSHAIFFTGRIQYYSTIISSVVNSTIISFVVNSIKRTHIPFSININSTDANTIP
jgi:hypothetical protein